MDKVRKLRAYVRANKRRACRVHMLDMLGIVLWRGVTRVWGVARGWV